MFINFLTVQRSNNKQNCKNDFGSQSVDGKANRAKMFPVRRLTGDLVQDVVNETGGGGSGWIDGGVSVGCGGGDGSGVRGHCSRWLGGWRWWGWGWMDGVHRGVGRGGGQRWGWTGGRHDEENDEKISGSNRRREMVRRDRREAICVGDLISRCQTITAPRVVTVLTAQLFGFTHSHANIRA